MKKVSWLRQGKGGAERQSAAVALFALTAVAAFPSAAQASIIVGSDLSEAAATSAQANACAPASAPCTSMLSGVKQGNPYPAASPANGTVIAFNIKSGGPSTVTFRLVHLDSAIAGKVIAATGDGTGPTAGLPGPGIYEFPANLPIKAGDYVGFDSSLFTAYGACQMKAYSFGFNPPLTDGGPLQQAQTGGSCELLVNAVVVPSAAFVLGKGTVTRATGKAKLSLRLPGPGKLVLMGKGIKRISKNVGQAGPLNLPLTLTASTRNKLASRGSVKLKLSATFTPTGGSPNAELETVKLKHRR